MATQLKTHIMTYNYKKLARLIILRNKQGV